MVLTLPTLLTAGTIIAERYVTVTLLGRGGMGAIYEATNLVTGRGVALKIPRAELVSSAVFRARFLREARAASVLSHPNVIDVLDVVVHGDQTPVIVMELLRGQSLAELLATNGRLSLAEAATHLVPILDALGLAHERGIVHRDFKPENIFLAEEPGGGTTPKLLDFGIAKLAPGSDVAPEAAGTATGAMLGTPYYMAPEQVSGVRDIDARADVWAAGAVVYECLAGRRIFSGENFGQIFVAIVQTSPPALETLIEGLPSPVTAAVHAALTRDRAERPAGVRGLIDALAPHVGATVRRTLTLPPRRPTSSKDAVFAVSAEADTVSANGVDAPLSDDATSPAASGTAIAAAQAIALAETARSETLAAASGASGRGAETPAAALGPAAGVTRWRTLTIGLGAAALLGVLGLANSFKSAPPQAAASSAPSASATPAAPAFAPVNPRRLTFDEGCEEFPRWSHDGRSILFDGASGKDTHVFALDLAGGARRPLTSGAGWQMAPAVSPRGDFIAYLVMSSAADGAYVAAPDGGSPRRISPIPSMRPSFSPDGAFLWAGNGRKPERIDLRSGETVRVLTPPDASVLPNVIELADGRVIGRAEPMYGAAGLVIFAAGQNTGTWLWREEVEEAVEVSANGSAVIVARQTESQITDLWRVPLDGSAPERLGHASLHPTKGLHVSPDGARVVWSNCRSLQHLARTIAGPTPGTLAFAPGARTNEWTDQRPNALGQASRVLIVSTRTGRPRPCLIDLEEREPARCLDIGELVPSEAAPSPDGKHYVFSVIGKGLFHAPLDGSAPPRLLLGLPEGELFGDLAFTPDGRDVTFTRTVKRATPVVDAIAIDGGAPRRFLEGSAEALVFSPKGDRGAFLARGKGPASRPMVIDLTSKKVRPLAADLPEAQHERAAWSTSGARVTVLRGMNEAIEVDVATGKVMRRLDAGNDQISGVTYVRDELVVARETWIGDIWVADLR